LSQPQEKLIAQETFSLGPVQQEMFIQDYLMM